MLPQACVAAWGATTTILSVKYATAAITPALPVWIHYRARAATLRPLGWPMPPQGYAAVLQTTWTTEYRSYAASVLTRVRRAPYPLYA